MMRRIVAGLLAVLALGGLAAAPAGAQVLRVGSIMPDLLAHDQNGATVTLQSLMHIPLNPQGQGGQPRVVVLAFVTGDCKNCAFMNANWAPALAKWDTANYQYGFAQMLVYGKERKPSTQADAKAWAATTTIPNRIVLFETPGGDLERLAGLRGFNVTEFPLLVLIGADQRIRVIIRGDNLVDLDKAVAATQPKSGLLKR